MRREEVRAIRQFELKAMSEGGSGGFEGYANVYNIIDGYGDIVAPGAFADSLPAFLKEGFIGGINHDWNEPIGKPLEAREDTTGLFLKAMLSSIQDAQDARTLMQEGILQKLSIGFRTLSAEYVDSEGAQAFWNSVGYSPTPEDMLNLGKAVSYWGEVRIIRKGRLIEVSPVTLPANQMADITSVKGIGCLEGGKIGTLREAERFLHETLGASNSLANRFLADVKAILLREAEGEPEEKAAQGEPDAVAETTEVALEQTETTTIRNEIWTLAYKLGVI